jgi:hypothetical protein
MIRLFIISLMFWSCTGNSPEEAKINSISYDNYEYNVLSDSLLRGIQSKILMAFGQSMMTKDAKSITDLDADLEKLYETRKSNLVIYWRSYLKFYESIFYVGIKDEKKAGKVCSAGIDFLEDLKNKNAEDYALLAMLQGFSFQFHSGMKAPFIAKKVEANLQAALVIDSSNLRVNYVIANNDFYTPEKYGGGKKVERYALKAISLPAQKVKNEYLPSWGKEEAYETLIKYYIKKEKWDLAVKYYKEANGAYPQSYLLGQLAPQLVGK